VELDLPTLLVLNGLIVMVCGVVFILNTAFNRNDSVGRIWSTAFIAAMVVTIVNGSTENGPIIWWTIAVANVAWVIALGSLWSGLRRYNGRSRGFWTLAVISFLILGATLLHGEPAGRWAGAAELWISLALLSVLGAFEAVRGRLRRNLSGQVVAVALGAAATAAALRAMVFLRDGSAGKTFIIYFNDANFAVFSLCLIVLTAVAVSVLRAEQGSSHAVGDQTDGIHSMVGVLSASAFTQAATDHLARAHRAGVPLVLIGADIDNLPQINVAFGRAAGDEAIARFATQLRSCAPVLSVVGHRASGRFFMLAAVDSLREARSIVEGLQAAIVDEPLKEASHIRLTASFGIANTLDYGYALTALSIAVSTAVATVQVRGGNDTAAAYEPVTDQDS